MKVTASVPASSRNRVSRLGLRRLVSEILPPAAERAWKMAGRCCDAEVRLRVRLLSSWAMISRSGAVPCARLAIACFVSSSGKVPLSYSTSRALSWVLRSATLPCAMSLPRSMMATESQSRSASSM